MLRYYSFYYRIEFDLQAEQPVQQSRKSLRKHSKKGLSKSTNLTIENLQKEMTEETSELMEIDQSLLQEQKDRITMAELK